MDTKTLPPDEKMGWLVLSGFRWVALGNVSLMLLVGDDFSVSKDNLWPLLAAAGAYTLVLSIGWNLWPRLFARSLLPLTVDAAICFGLLYFSGGGTSPFYLYSLSPVLVAAFMRGGWAVALTAFAGLHGYVLSAVLNGYSFWELVRTSSTTLSAYLIAAVLLSYPSRFMRQLGERNRELAEAQESLAGINQNLRSVNRQMVSLQAINSVLQSFLDLPRVIGSVSDGIKYGLDFDRVVIGLVDDGASKVADWRVVGGYANLEDTWRLLEVSIEDGSPARELFDRLEPLSVGPEGHQAVDPWLHACVSADAYVITPLGVRSKPIGLIVVDNAKSGRPITHDDIQWLKILSTQAAIAINNAQLYAKAQELAAVTERNRIAMEIHDGLSQTLSGARLILNSCHKLLPPSESRVQAKLAYLDGMLARSYDETRYAIFNLRLPFLAFENLTSFFHDYLREFSEFSGIKTNFIVSGTEPEALSDGAKLCLRRVLQESLANARKHSEATSLTVFCYFQNQKAALKVVDNGRGFLLDDALADAETGKTFGILAAESRVKRLGGSLTISSAPGKGTTVTLIMPYRVPAEVDDFDKSAHR